MTLKEFLSGEAELLAGILNLGPLERGHYIQIGLGTGFYIPEADYQAAQARANELRAVQFVGITKGGKALHGTRDEIHGNRDSAGLVAWIFPQSKDAEPWHCGSAKPGA